MTVMSQHSLCPQICSQLASVYTYLHSLCLLNASWMPLAKCFGTNEHPPHKQPFQTYHNASQPGFQFSMSWNIFLVYGKKFSSKKCIILVRDHLVRRPRTIACTTYNVTYNSLPCLSRCMNGTMQFEDGSTKDPVTNQRQAIVLYDSLFTCRMTHRGPLTVESSNSNNRVYTMSNCLHRPISLWLRKLLYYFLTRQRSWLAEIYLSVQCRHEMTGLPLNLSRIWAQIGMNVQSLCLTGWMFGLLAIIMIVY